MVGGVKQLLLICAVVVGQSILAADKKPLTKEESAKVIEAAIRKAAKKPTGELTKADYEKVTVLVFYKKQLTNVKGLEKLTQLERLQLQRNHLTDAKGLEKLTKLWMLDLSGNQLNDVKGLEKLTQLKQLNLGNNPNLTKAQIAELKKALPKCGIYSNTSVVADNKPPVAAADDLPQKIKALLDKYKEMRTEDPDKAGAQAIKDSGKLARENPDEVRPWSLYLSAARFAKDPKEKKAIFQEVAAAKSSKLASVVAKAKGELTKLDALGKPVDIKFTAIDGREVNLAKMKGKVVQASQGGMDADSYTALHQDFTSLLAQIETIVTTAEFNGTNLLTQGASDFKVLSTVDGSTITVSAQSLDATTLAISSTGASLTDATKAATALTAINTAITTVSNALASLGASAKRVEIQRDFTGKLTDVLKQGVGNLVDADLAEESAKLQSLQIKQQLGVEALSIANSNPQSILALFR